MPAIPPTRIMVREGDALVFPNGVTMTYNTWAEQIIAKPPTDHRLRTAISTADGPLNDCIILEVR